VLLGEDLLYAPHALSPSFLFTLSG